MCVCVCVLITMDMDMVCFLLCVPQVSSELDVSNFDEEFTSQSTAESVIAEPVAFGKNAKTNFDNFTYVDQGHLNLS